MNQQHHRLFQLQRQALATAKFTAPINHLKLYVSHGTWVPVCSLVVAIFFIHVQLALWHTELGTVPTLQRAHCTSVAGVAARSQVSGSHRSRLSHRLDQVEGDSLCVIHFRWQCRVDAWVNGQPLLLTSIVCWLLYCLLYYLLFLVLKSVMNRA